MAGREGEGFREDTKNVFHAGVDGQGLRQIADRKLRNFFCRGSD